MPKDVHGKTATGAVARDTLATNCSAVARDTLATNCSAGISEKLVASKLSVMLVKDFFVAEARGTGGWFSDRRAVVQVCQRGP